MSRLFKKIHRDMYTKSMHFFIQVVLMHLICASAFCQNWSTATLNEGKGNMSTGSIGPYVFFFSGDKWVGNTRYLVSQIEMIDTRTGAKITSILPNDSMRYRTESVSDDGKIYFAGGEGYLNGGSFLNQSFFSNKVDVFDTLTGSWSVLYMSEAKTALAAGAGNGKVLFGGGRKKDGGSSVVTNTVDIYNPHTDLWNKGVFLPGIGVRQRDRLTAVSFMNKIYFAGGATNSVIRDVINIYDAVSETWHQDTLKESKYSLKSFTYKNAIYFAGGQSSSTIPSDTIEVYRPLTDSWEYIKIPYFFKKIINGQERPYLQVIQAGCKVFLIPSPNTSGFIPNQPEFSSADSVAVYDLARKKWSYIDLPSKNIGVTAVATQNKIYFAGGADSATAVYSNIIDILTLEPILQLAVANTPVTAYDFGKVVTGDLLAINVTVSNEGDYDLLFKDLAQRISISGDVDDFSIDPGMLQLTDTLEPAEIITLPVSFHPTTIGTKQVTITINSNDPSTPAYTLVVKGTVAEEDIPTSVRNPSENNIAVYPNPTSGMLHVHSNQQSALTVEVVNLQGQTVKKQTGTDDSGIDISALPDGFYLVKVTCDQSSSVIKVLKQ